MRGSVYHRCTCVPEFDAKGNRKRCTKRGCGSWYFHFEGMSAGRRVQYKRGGYATRRDAEAALAEVVDNNRRGVRPTPARLTVADYLTAWLTQKQVAGLRPTTARSYAGHIEAYLKPHLGHILLNELTALDVEEALRKVRADPKRRMSVSTLRRVHATLRSALGSAEKKRLIPYNPAAKADLPTSRRPQVTPWEPSELGTFLDAVSTDRLGPVFEVMANSGLRRGEVLGLRWGDVDADAGFITVRRQLLDIAGDGTCPWCDGTTHPDSSFGPPKTSSGENRIVHLDEGTLGTLLTHRLYQDRERAHWGTGYLDHGLVFAREDGVPIAPDHLTKRFGQLAKATGLRAIRLHDLRHGQASMMLAANVPLAVVSKRLGHSSIALTADTYSHLLKGVDRRAAEAAAALVPRLLPYQFPTNRAKMGPKSERISPRTTPKVQGGKRKRSGPRRARTDDLRIKSP
jgi:integrase